MRPVYHAIASTVLSAGVYAVTKSVPAAAVQWVGGVLIDTDHIAEYFARKKGRRSFSDFFSIQMNESFEKIVFPFHGWELAVVFGFLAGLFATPVVGFSLWLGMTQHLAFDQAVNPARPFSYFIIFRMVHKFKTAVCFPSSTAKK